MGPVPPPYYGFYAYGGGGGSGGVGPVPPPYYGGGASLPDNPISDAIISAQLLGSSGDLYFEITAGGEAYASNASVLLNASSVQRGEAKAPVLTLVLDTTGAVTEVTVPCQPSEISTLTPAGCALTTNYGRLGEVSARARITYTTFGLG